MFRPRLPENNITGLSENPGHVKNVCRQFWVHEDAALATELQNSEFELKYKRNNDERRMARQDVPIARQFVNIEEERAQQQMEHHVQRNKRITEDDAVIAQQMQSEELIRKEQERVRREYRDKELAKQIQAKEEKRLELRMKEKDLKRQRKMLERELRRESKKIFSSRPGEAETSRVAQLSDGVANINFSRETVQDVKIRPDGKVEDCGDFSDFYVQPSQHLPDYKKKELQCLQDEELAKLLQDQEHKRGSQVCRDQLKEIEMKDAELAKLIQEQERLKRSRRKHRRSAEGSRQTSDPGNLTPPVENLPFPHSHSLPQDGDFDFPNRRDDVRMDFRIPERDRRRSPHRNNLVNSVSDYATRPLPDTPSPEPLPQLPRGYNLSLMRALDHNMDQRTSAVVMSDVRRAPVVLPDDGDWLPITPSPPTSFDCHQHQTTTGDNIFAAIDPTFVHHDNRRHSGRVRSSSAHSSPKKYSQSAVQTVEDNYCNLDDIRAIANSHSPRHGSRDHDDKDSNDFNLIQGQRRPGFARDSQRSSGRRTNCKQQ